MTIVNPKTISENTFWHSMPIEEVFQQLGSSPQGLATSEAILRLKHFGQNIIARQKSISPLQLLLKQFASFFVIALLLAATLAFVVSFLPGEGGRRLTGFFMLGIVVLSVTLSFYQEYHAQRELEALEKLLAFKVNVLRDGAPHQVDASEVVPGDILVLSYGQRVPADARIVQAQSLRADESSLTGESIGIDKSPLVVAPEALLSERSSMVYASSYITHGTGMALVVQTGMNTEVGKIATMLTRIVERPTPFQFEVQRMARQMTIIVAVLASLVAAILLFVLHEPLVDVALNSLSLAVATIPESLPIVLTFALALGAHQMADRNAIVRRLAVVESLGSVDTICTDKTGTLTTNQMTVQRFFANGCTSPLPSENCKPDPATIELLRAGILCNEANPKEEPTLKFIGDPVDIALLKAAHSCGLNIPQERADYPKSKEIPFSSERKMMTTIHHHNERYVAYTKGAPEAILPKCTHVLSEDQLRPLDSAQYTEIEHVIAQLEGEAWYVLAFARKDNLQENAIAQAEQDLVFIGLQAMNDPPRPEAAAAIAQAHTAGIRVVMITGDNVLTAKAVAQQLDIRGECANADQLDNLSDQELTDQVKSVGIIARATPQTKQRILKSLQDSGHFVAMTGDGVNDAPALKQSDVGIAMGLRGTDIARGSSAMVLIDDNFATIVAAVEEGRRIFDNIRKFTNYLLSTSLGEVFVVLMLSIYGYFPLSAKMLLWVNLVTDLIPASALAADPAVPAIMQRRPRRHNEPILNRAIHATIAGSIFRTLIAYGLIFWIGLQLSSVTYARTMLFTSIVLHSFTRVMVVRQMDNLSIWSNKALLWSYLAAVALQLIALYTPLSTIFGIVPLDWRAWAIMVPIVGISSFTGVIMTRWILKWIPLWEN